MVVQGVPVAPTILSDTELTIPVTPPSLFGVGISVTHPSGDTLPSSTSFITIVPAASKFVFLTVESVTGDIGGAGPLSGVPAGDAVCNAQAAFYDLPGTYKAWLSDTTSSPATDFVQHTGPYVSMAAAQIAPDWAGLTTGIDAWVATTPDGTFGATAWTGTNGDGTPAADNCLDWTDASSGVNGSYGAPTSVTGAEWTATGVRPCSDSARLICFEQ